MQWFLSWRGVLACVSALVVLLVVATYLPLFVYPSLTQPELQGVGGAAARIGLENARYQLQNNFRSELLQALGAMFVVAGAVAAWVQIRIARDGQVTDRFTRAIDQLGSEKLDVRLGGIYALERLSLNSPADRPSVTPVLGAFVRGRASWPVGAPDGGPEHPTPAVEDRMPWLTHRAADVQTAMHVLARRPGHPQEPRLYLSRTDLRKMNLTGGILRNTYLRHANLASAWLQDAHLEDSDLTDADLREANLRGAHLVRADLKGAYLQGADLQRADLSQATLRNTDLRGTNLSGALLDGTDLTDVQQDNSTRWPAGYIHPERTAADEAAR